MRVACSFFIIVICSCSNEDNSFDQFLTKGQLKGNWIMTEGFYRCSDGSLVNGDINFVFNSDSTIYVEKYILCDSIDFVSNRIYPYETMLWEFNEADQYVDFFWPNYSRVPNFRWTVEQFNQEYLEVNVYNTYDTLDITFSNQYFLRKD